LGPSRLHAQGCWYQNCRPKDEQCNALLNRPGTSDVPVYYHIVSHYEDVSKVGMGELLQDIKAALPYFDEEVYEAWNSAPAEFLYSKEPVDKESYDGLYDTDLTIEDKERIKEHVEVANIKLPEQTRKHIWLNEPADPEEHEKLLPKKRVIVQRTKRDELTHHYTLTCDSEETLKVDVQNIFETEFKLQNTYFKANIIFSHTLEKPQDDDTFLYEIVTVNPQFQHRTPTYIRQEHPEDFDKFNVKINDDLRYLYAVRYSTSAIKPICVCQAVLVIYITKSVGGKVVLPEVLAKSHAENIVTYVNEYNLCFWISAYVFLHGELKMKLGNEKSKVKDLCREFYGVEGLEFTDKNKSFRMYPGFNIELEMSEFIKK